VANEDPGDPGFTDWEGCPDPRLDHSAMHDQCATNGIGDKIQEFLTHSDACGCDGRVCGEDGCGGSCGPPCCEIPAGVRYVYHGLWITMELPFVEDRFRAVPLDDAEAEVDLFAAMPALVGESGLDHSCSPSGEFVLVRSRAGEGTLYIYDRNGEVTTRPFPDEAAYSMPVLSGDRTRLAWWEKGVGLWLEDLETADKRIVTVNLREPDDAKDLVLSFSASADALVVSARTAGLSAFYPLNVPVPMDPFPVIDAQLVDWDNGTYESVYARTLQAPASDGSQAEAHVFIGGVSFYPTSDEVLFVSNEQFLEEKQKELIDPDYTADPAAGYELYRAFPGTGQATAVTNLSDGSVAGGFGLPAVAPSGSHAAYWFRQKEDQTFDLLLVDLGSKKTRPLITGSYDFSGRPCWLAAPTP
jgi:hypothetical protein